MNKNTPNIPDSRGKPLLSWKAPSHPHPERTKRWYITATVIIGTLLAYSIWSASWSFTALIVVLVLFYAWQHRKEPPEHTITITDHGFQVNSSFTPWNHCTGFWMLRGPDYVELHLERDSGINRDICIQTGSVNIELIAEVLSAFTVQRTDRGERTLDMITRILKI